MCLLVLCRILLLAICLPCLFYVQSVHAQSDQSALCSVGYVVYFGNGIMHDEVNSNGSRNLLREAIGTMYVNQPIDFQVSVNPSGGFLPDLIESFAQKLAEDPTLQWSMFFRWISGQFINSALSIAFDDLIGTRAVNSVAQEVTRLSSPAAFSDPTVVRHSETYRDQLLAGKKILIVAHSQGNLYANAVYRRLASTSGVNISAVSIAAVATPANSVVSGEGYVTTDADQVIGLVRLVAPATLADNEFSVPLLPAADRLGHGFNEIYISSAFPQLKSRVLSLTGAALSRLSRVTTDSATGPITTTMTWSSPGDVDLHTFEPGGHVYYGDPRGVVGYLDRDDTAGTGPEHYYAQCANFTAGSYRFGVNYYSGNGARTVTMQLSVLGISYPARTLVVTTSLGTSGNNWPSILFTVDVTKNANGQFSASVR